MVDEGSILKESLVPIALTVFPQCCQANKHLYSPKSQHTEYTHNNDKYKGRLPENPQIVGRVAKKIKKVIKN